MLRTTPSLLALLALSPLLHSSSCNPYYPSATAPDGFITFTFVNASQNASVTAGSIYLTCVGSTSDAGSFRDFILFNSSSATGALSPAGQTLPSQYFYPLSFFPQDGSGNAYAFVPETLAQGALYIGIDYPVVVNTLTGATWIINPPSFSSNDPNLYHLYDTISFATTPHLQFSGRDMQSAFGLPLAELVTYNGGNTTFYLGLPPSVPRDDTTSNSVFGSYLAAVNAISNSAAQTQWANGITSFIPAGNAGATTYLRLFSPTELLAIDLFDPAYLFNNTYGANWFESMWDSASGFYVAEPLYFDVSQLGAAYTTYQYTNTSGSTLTFVASNGGTGGTVTVSPTSTAPFLSSAPQGANSFNAGGDLGIAPTICQYLSDGFVTGLFPTAFPSGTPMNNTYIQNTYVDDPSTFWGHSNSSPAPAGGPWYNLYASVLHNFAPFSTSNNYSNINPETGDNPMGFNQNIPPLSIATTASVAIVLGSMSGSTLPNFTDSSSYTISIKPGASTTVIYGLTAITGPANQSFVGATSPIPLTIEYWGGSYAGLNYVVQVYINSPVADNYAFVYPEPPATFLPTFGVGQWNIGMGAPN